MIRQGMVQETLADFNNAGMLPPHLPQWSRVNTLDKARYPKAFLKDRLQPLPNLGMTLGGPDMKVRQDSQDSDDRELDLADSMNPQQRIQHLEKSLHFLRTQHQEVLANLHEEIDKLKRENKELQFRIVMVQKAGVGQSALRSSATKRASAKRQPSADRRARDVSAASRKSGKRGSEQIPPIGSAQHGNHAHIHDLADETELPLDNEEKMDEIKIIFLEEEIKEVKKTLKEEKHKNHYLSQLLEAAEKEKQKRQQEEMERLRNLPPPPPSSSIAISLETSFSNEKDLERTEVALAAAKAKEQEHEQEGQALAQHSAPLPFNASLNPLQVNLPAQASRQPTLRECEIIIRHLQHIGDKQAHELNQLKSDLRDVLYSHKWTPDAYLLAKAYIADDDAKETAESGKLPKIPLKNSTRKLPDIAYIQKDALSLPALRSGVGNQAVERRKRTQILQKAKMRREINHVDA